MRIGIHYANFTHPDWRDRLVDRLTETARVADQGGASLFTVMDHWFQMENLGGPAEPMLEGYTTLGYLAGSHRAGPAQPAGHRRDVPPPRACSPRPSPPSTCSRGGRAMLGIGAAWYEREHAGLGVPFPSTSERFERLEETLQIVRQMWSDDDGAVRRQALPARRDRLRPAAGAAAAPADPDRRRSGERKTLRLVAQYADACNLFGEGPGRRPRTSSRCCAGTATTSGATTTRSRRR